MIGPTKRQSTVGQRRNADNLQTKCTVQALYKCTYYRTLYNRAGLFQPTYSLVYIEFQLSIGINPVIVSCVHFYSSFSILMSICFSGWSYRKLFITEFIQVPVSDCCFPKREPLMTCNLPHLFGATDYINPIQPTLLIQHFFF